LITGGKRSSLYRYMYICLITRNC